MADFRCRAPSHTEPGRSQCTACLFEGPLARGSDWNLESTGGAASNIEWALGQTWANIWSLLRALVISIQFYFYSLAIKQHDIHWYTIIHNLIPLITTIDMHQLPILLWKHLARKFATILSYLFRCVPSEVPSSFWRLWKCHSGIRSNRFGHHQQEYPLQTSPQWWNSHPSAFRWKRCDPPRYLLSQHRTNCWQRPRQWSSQPSLVQSQVIIKPCHFLVYVYVVCECVCV